MSFVVDHGQFDRACARCPDPDECDMCGYCALGLPSGHQDGWERAAEDDALLEGDE